jgi:hypothetical protein
MVALTAMASTSAVAGSVPDTGSKKPGKPTYQLVFVIDKGNYGSTISGDGYSTTENDNFAAVTTYNPVPIARTGKVSFKQFSKKEEFSSDGNGPQWEKYGSTGFDCKAELKSDPEIVPLMRGTSSGNKLSLDVELVAQAEVFNATGHTGTSVRCDRNPYWPNGSVAFYPASTAHPKGPYVVGMFSAELDVSLPAVRKLKVGATMKAGVDSTHNIDKRPPANCDEPGETCTQQVGWKGSIELTRTS